MTATKSERRPCGRLFNRFLATLKHLLYLSKTSIFYFANLKVSVCLCLFILSLQKGLVTVLHTGHTKSRRWSRFKVNSSMRQIEVCRVMTVVCL